MSLLISLKSLISASFVPVVLIGAGTMLSPAIFAHEIDEPAAQDTLRHAYDTPRSDQGFNLPSQAEIEAIKKQLPDMTGIMNDMMSIVQDEDMQNSLQGSLDILKEHVGENGGFAKTDQGVPDVTAMMGSMLDLMGDEAFIGGLLDAAEPLKETLEKHIPDAEISAPDWQ